MSLQLYRTPVLLVAGLVAIVSIASVIGDDQLRVTVTEMLIRMIVVVGMYLFIGNSGIMSFGHVGFMCIGAYAAGWVTADPSWKQVMLTGLPGILQQAEYPFPVAPIVAGLLAAVVGLALGSALMRLSGLAAAIGTFSFLAIVNSVYSSWDSVTGGLSSIVNIPVVVDSWAAVAFAGMAIFIAFIFQNSRYGLMLRASRDDEIAAKSASIRVIRVRLAAFVLSAFVVGMGGGLYAQFLGIVNTDAFYFGLTFVTLSMLVVGGVGSLTGAVVGTFAVTLIAEALRFCERGLEFGGQHFGLPHGTQELGLGIVMALVLIFRPTGIAAGRELSWPLTLILGRQVTSGRSRTTVQGNIAADTACPNGAKIN